MAVQSIKNKIKSGSLLVGNAPFIPNSYESIATVTVGSGGQSTITFSSIPSTYQHLQIRYTSRVNVADTGENIWLRFNGDTGNNYSYHYILGDGSSASSAGSGSFTRILSGRTAGNNTTANVFGASVIDILDYANTNKNTTARTLTGLENNGSGVVFLESGGWFNTSAVTSITLAETSGNSFVQYSQFALYGIKG
jgi:hypothetical protein